MTIVELRALLDEYDVSPMDYCIGPFDDTPKSRYFYHLEKEGKQYKVSDINLFHMDDTDSYHEGYISYFDNEESAVEEFLQRLKYGYLNINELLGNPEPEIMKYFGTYAYTDDEMITIDWSSTEEEFHQQMLKYEQRQRAERRRNLSLFVRSDRKDGKPGVIMTKITER